METDNFPPPAGAVRHPEPGLRRILAPNPSPMTGAGTNSYILGRGRVAVIDPGPDLPDHLDSLLAALAPGESVSHIIVTHAHRDHSPAARPLSRRTGAPVLAFGDAGAGRSPLMAQLAAEGLGGGGEGVDSDFAPDIRLDHDATVEGAGWRLTVHWTPGHFGNHICLQWGDRVFSGDHVMGWASTLISPPDGDLNAYMRGLDHLAAIAPARLYPGHGAPVSDPPARLAELTRHRHERARAIRAALDATPATVEEIAARVYTDTSPELHAAAAHNVLAHLIDLWQQGQAAPDGPLQPGTRFRRA